MGIHYFAHKTNLVVITLFNLELVHQLEAVLQNLLAFFVHNPKKFFEFQKLTDLIQWQ
jgi:hypothetical protein